MKVAKWNCNDKRKGASSTSRLPFGCAQEHSSRLSLSMAIAMSEQRRMAEGEGFEPSIELPLYHLSKMAH